MLLRFVFCLFLVLGPFDTLAFLGFGAVPAWAKGEQAAGEVMDEGKHKITFQPFEVMLLRRGKVKGVADIQLVLQLHENQDYERLNTLKPQLGADIAAALSSLARQYWDVNRPIDPDVVSNYLKPIVARRVGADKLDVYVLRALITPK